MWPTFSQDLKNFCMKISKKHYEQQQIYLTTDKIKAKHSEYSFFSNAKLYPPKFGVTFRQLSHTKIDIM